jgi:hypothetical protein
MRKRDQMLVMEDLKSRSESWLPLHSCGVDDEVVGVVAGVALAIVLSSNALVPLYA